MYILNSYNILRLKLLYNLCYPVELVVDDDCLSVWDKLRAMVNSHIDIQKLKFITEVFNN